MSLFDRLKKTKAAGGGTYFEPGKYLCEIDRVRNAPNRTGQQMRVMEFVVLETLVDQTMPFKAKGSDKLEEKRSNKPGTTPAQVLIWDGNYDETKDANYKSFLLAALNVEESDFDNAEEETLNEFMKLAEGGDGTGLKGTKILVVAAKVKARAGHDFTKVTYQAWEEGAEAA